MHTSNFGVYQLLSFTSVCQTLFLECALILLRVKILPHTQQAKAISYIHRKDNWEGRSYLSVKYTLPTLVSVSSSPSPLFAELEPKVASEGQTTMVQEARELHVYSYPIVYHASLAIELRIVIHTHGIH